MYRVHNRVILNINYTYNKLTFKCIARTMLCIMHDPLTACQIAGEEAKKFIAMKLKEINPFYDLHIISISYNYAVKYKFQGLQVPECKAKASFYITYKGEKLGTLLSIGLIQKLIQDNNNCEYFDFGDAENVRLNQL